MKRAAVLFSVFFAAAVYLAAPAAYAQTFEVGTKLESFSLPDLDGKTRTLDELKGKNGSLVVFLSAQCPVVKSYNARINEIAEAYAAKGINFIGINSNSTESLEWVKSDAAEVGYKFPLLIDKGNVLADKLGASVTPEAYYFDANNVLLYHGAIDNDKSGKNISDHYLRTAFDSALAGTKIAQTRAKAFGCTIKRVGEQ